MISPQGCVKSHGMSCLECLLLPFTIAVSWDICPQGCLDMAGLTLCPALVLGLQGHSTWCIFSSPPGICTKAGEYDLFSAGLSHSLLPVSCLSQGMAKPSPVVLSCSRSPGHGIALIQVMQTHSNLALHSCLGQLLNEEMLFWRG